MRIVSVWLVWLVLWGIFSWVGVNNLDPDFGWHLKVGDLLWKSGIPKTDPFSYTMPSFGWVDHGRLTDMAISWLYPRVGMMGLAGVFGAVATLALMVAVPVNSWKWSIVPVFLSAGVLINRSGIRPQVEDWLFLAIILRLLRNEMWWKRWKWIVPIIFAGWSNLHGGFVAGLAVLGVGIGAKWIEGVRRNKKDLLVMGLSILAVGVNPYGMRVWEEVWLTMTDSYLRQTISEWKPFYVKAELSFWMLVAWLGALVTKFYKN